MNKINLTENEKRDIIKCIEADKPLPDKYRFLLFEDKKEVELVWNEKTSDVTNVVLPFQTIEVVDEPRAEIPDDTKRQQNLFYVDKRGRQIAGWTNKLIWGDNKLILSSLKSGAARDEIEKIKRLYQWCEDINSVQKVKFTALYVKQEEYEKYTPSCFRQLVETFDEI